LETIATKASQSSTRLECCQITRRFRDIRPDFEGENRKLIPELKHIAALPTNVDHDHHVGLNHRINICAATIIQKMIISHKISVHQLFSIAPIQSEMLITLHSKQEIERNGSLMNDSKRD
jgi:hypothetical protein